MADKITSSVYLIIEPGRRRGLPAFSIRGMRQSKPRLESGQLAVKVKLNLDPSLFDEYIPTLEATIEGHDLIQPEIEVVDQTPEI